MFGYISTRGKAPHLNFADAALAGLAIDGGLYIPENFPKVSEGEIINMAQQPYVEIAWRVLLPFMGESVYPSDLVRMLNAAYGGFAHKDVTPLRRFDDGFYVQELFHGPTLSFKDVAMQFMGPLFGVLLAQKKRRMTIVAATSGDTGSAAIEAFRSQPAIDVFILHPKGRISEVQRRQMTTVQADNIFNIAVSGSFDDCQDIVKTLFADAKFRDEAQLSAANSINMARVLAQAVYYFHASARMYGKTGKLTTFCVPTGNFGNIYAGYIAQSMGAPIERLIAATNRNDILHRFFGTGRLHIEEVKASLSPSMDIQVSSNLERLLFDLLQRNGELTATLMQGFREKGEVQFGPEIMEKLRVLFSSGRMEDAETLAVMRRIYAEKGYMADPHAAVGIGVAEAYQKANPDSVIVSLATAHPAKFPDAVKSATGETPALPPALAGLYDRDERCETLPPDAEKIKDFVRQNMRS